MFEPCRPGSRLGYVDPERGYPDLDTSRLGNRFGDSRYGSGGAGTGHRGGGGRYHHEDRYSHYQNYQEIQAQMARHDYYQQRYQQYLAHQQAALAHSAHAQRHAASLSGSQLMPPPLPPRAQPEFHPSQSQRAYPATEPRGNWADHRYHHLLITGGSSHLHHLPPPPSSSQHQHHHPRSLTPNLPHEMTRSASPGRGYYPPAHHHPAGPAPAPLHASQHSYSLDYMALEDPPHRGPRPGAYGADASATAPPSAAASAQFGSLPRRTARSHHTVSEAARV